MFQFSKEHEQGSRRIDRVVGQDETVAMAADFCLGWA
jgi:hypothetical protein